MPLKREHYVRSSHARAVVADLNHVQPTRSEPDMNAIRACIDGIFHQFFQCASGSFNHFACCNAIDQMFRSEEHTSELQSLMRISYAVFCLTKQIILNYLNTSHINKCNQNIERNS